VVSQRFPTQQIWKIAPQVGSNVQVPCWQMRVEEPQVLLAQQRSPLVPQSPASDAPPGEEL
jgi:hypothetical protein